MCLNMTDVFNNSSNDYIYPGLSPCPGTGEDQYLVWTADGLCIIKGASVISCISFADLEIPVNGFSKEQKILGTGEVTFIPGLTKGLCNKYQGFTMPYLVSTNSALNPYFMQIDLSINYYKNFSYVMGDVDASASYVQNISIDTAVNLAFGTDGINITSVYDPCIFSFTGGLAGYEFDITNVVLSIIDISMNANSPFAHEENAEQYVLVEDVSAAVPSAKYPNTAMQGIILKGTYPYEYQNTVLCEEDKWVQINHVTDYVTTCDPLDVNYDTSVLTELVIDLLPFGTQPIVDNDFSVADSSCGLYDISLGNLTLVHGTDISIGQNIIFTVVDDYDLLDCSITSSTITNSYIEGFLVTLSELAGISLRSTPVTKSEIMTDSSIYDGSISESIVSNSFAEIGTWVDVSVSGTTFLDTDIASSYVTGSIFQGDSSFYGNIISSVVEDSSIKNYILSLTDVSVSYLKDSSIAGGNGNLNIYDNTVVWNSNISDSSILCSYVEDSSIVDSYIVRSNIYDSDFYDVSIYKGYVEGSNFDALVTNFIEDTSIYSSVLTNTATNNCEIGQSTIVNSVFSDTKFGGSHIMDSSIIADSIVNNDSSIVNSYIANSWTNTYKLLVYTDPCTGDPSIYEYVTNDETLGLDVSLNTVSIYESEIWDSSLNNAIVYDSSLYNTYLEDSELIRCTTYNCAFDASTIVDASTRDILIDPSIGCEYTITMDTSTFYLKHRRRLEVGMSGCSTQDLMSAGDYLNWVSTNGFWKKVGAMYIWTTAADGTSDCYNKNLIDGFYVFNPHTFPVKIEYMVFV